MLAEAMGRSHAELMASVSKTELIKWRVLREVEAKEADDAAKKNQ